MCGPFPAMSLWWLSVHSQERPALLEKCTYDNEVDASTVISLEENMLIAI